WLMMEHGGRSWRQLAGIAVADNGAGRLQEGVEDSRFTLAKFQVVHRSTDELRRFGDRGTQSHVVEREPLLASYGRFDPWLERIPVGDNLLDEVLWPTELESFESRHGVHHTVVLDHHTTVSCDVY